MRFVKPSWLNSLSLKILLAYIVGVVLSVALIALSIFEVMINESRYFSAKDMTRLSQDFSKHIDFNVDGQPIGFDSAMENFSWIFESMKQEVAYRISDKDGRIAMISDAGESFWNDSDNAYQKVPGSFKFEYQSETIYGATAIVDRGEKIWYFQLAVSARLHYLLHQGIGLRFMGVGILLFSLVLLVVFGICGYITLKYTLKPLRKVSESAAAVSPRSIHARLLTEKVPYEIEPLVNSFNRVLDRLEHGYRLQQDFLTTAAHELKTPLALIRAQIELKEKGNERDMLLNDVAHMARQVQQLLLLAEVSEEKNYCPELVDVSGVVNEVVAYLEPMATATNVYIKIDCLHDVIWYADRSALFVLLKNLIENAIQHSPESTDVSIKITHELIIVRDWGPGMDESTLSNIFIKFWRGAHRRDHGAGLGMTICLEIAQAHGWLLSVQRADPGLFFKLEKTKIKI